MNSKNRARRLRRTLEAVSRPLDSALLDAVWEGSDKKVRRLLARGANPGARFEAKGLSSGSLSWEKTYKKSPPPSGWTALMSAAEKGHTEIVQALLAGGADIKAKLEKGNWTALTLAAYHNHTDIVELLKEAGGEEGEDVPHGFGALSWSKRIELIFSLFWGAGIITFLTIFLSSLLAFRGPIILISLTIASPFIVIWSRFIVKVYLKRPYSEEIIREIIGAFRNATMKRSIPR